MYTAPCSLSRFLKTWKVPEAKGIFPHGYFAEIEDLQEIKFPPKSAFYDSIKRCDIDDNLYNEVKQDYERRLELPVSHPDKFNNMLCYLRHYNLLGIFYYKGAFIHFHRLPTFGSSHFNSISKLFQKLQRRSVVLQHTSFDGIPVRDCSLNNF